MSGCKSEFEIPPTPTCVEEFSREWLKYVLDDWFAKNDIKTEAVDIVSFSAALNSLQVIVNSDAFNCINVDKNYFFQFVLRTFKQFISKLDI